MFHDESTKFLYKCPICYGCPCFSTNFYSLTHVSAAKKGVVLITCYYMIFTDIKSFSDINIISVSKTYLSHP